MYAFFRLGAPQSRLVRGGAVGVRGGDSDLRDPGPTALASLWRRGGLPPDPADGVVRGKAVRRVRPFPFVTHADIVGEFNAERGADKAFLREPRDEAFGESDAGERQLIRGVEGWLECEVNGELAYWGARAQLDSVDRAGGGGAAVVATPAAPNRSLTALSGSAARAPSVRMPSPAVPPQSRRVPRAPRGGRARRNAAEPPGATICTPNLGEWVAGAVPEWCVPPVPR